MENVYPITSAKSIKKNVKFTIIENRFIEAGFDPYTIALYLRIVMRAANNEKGCFEKKTTVAEKSGISEKTQKRCRSLLQYCNIIKIAQRKKEKNPRFQSSSMITLVSSDEWYLDHEHRDAWEFSKWQKEEKEKLGSVSEGRSDPFQRVVTTLYIEGRSDPHINKIPSNKITKNNIFFKETEPKTAGRSDPKKNKSKDLGKLKTQRQKEGQIGAFAVKFVGFMQELRATPQKKGFWDYYKTKGMIEEIIVLTGKGLEEVINNVDQLMVWEGLETFVNLRKADENTITGKIIEWCHSKDELIKVHAQAKQRKQEEESRFYAEKAESDRKWQEDLIAHSNKPKMQIHNSAEEQRRIDECKERAEKLARDKAAADLYRQERKKKEEAALAALAPKTPEEIQREKEEIAKIIGGY